MVATVEGVTYAAKGNICFFSMKEFCQDGGCGMSMSVVTEDVYS